MLNQLVSKLSKNKLRLFFGSLFLALCLPALILINQTYKQLKWEAFHQHRLLAEELVKRIDTELQEWVEKEESRPFADYQFLNITGTADNNLLQQSPLSRFPPNNTMPGVLGYFQIDTAGKFSTPLLPMASTSTPAYGIPTAERQQRQNLQLSILRVLSENKLIKTDSDLETYKTAAGIANQPIASAAPKNLTKKESYAELEEDSIEPQAAFELLNQEPNERKISKPSRRAKNYIGRLEDFSLDSSYAEQSISGSSRADIEKIAPTISKRMARKSREALPETLEAPPAPVEENFADTSAGDVATINKQIKINIFEGEIDPFEFSLLDSGHLVLYRKVWRDSQRHIQGILINRDILLQQLIENEFRNTNLSTMSNLIIAYQGFVVSILNTSKSGRALTRQASLQGTLLYRSRLSAPFTQLELVLNIIRLPATAATKTVTWVSIALILILCGSFYLMYRFTLKQHELSRQQQNFVSSVSHELKTPLTSIRMYGEILKEGWASEEKKQDYYAFIHDESERLSRLITNVLQLARMQRNDLELNIKPINVEGLLTNIRNKILSQLEQAGFTLNIDIPDPLTNKELALDTDAFTQIIINLIDNAIKFTTPEFAAKIDIVVRAINQEIIFSIRDYGPGIDKNQIKKIFQLFYRAENELTRTTSGTGIGLALVKQLTTAMDGKIDVLNREPGAEFRLSFPIIAPMA